MLYNMLPHGGRMPAVDPERREEEMLRTAKDLLDDIIKRLYNIHREAVVAALTIAQRADDVNAQVIRERLSSATDTWDKYLGFIVFLRETAKKLLSGGGGE